MKSLLLFSLGSLFLTLMGISSATLLQLVYYEVVALMAIKSDLNDPYHVLENWDSNSVDPCSWRMVTCSPDGLFFLCKSSFLLFTSSPISKTHWGLPSQSLSGTLSPLIGNLSELQSVLLQNNAISGPIPATIGKLEKLHTLDLSNNTFHGEIPTSLGDLKNLNYLRLNNNSLTGACPDSLSKIGGLTLVLSGFCTTENERLLVYPYMANGSVLSRLKDHIHGRPALDWSRRKRIALDFEAVVGDFGLAKLLDTDSHVTTTVRGTVGHIAPEYLSTGQSSEKTDVFGFGILLLELITGQKALDFGRGSNQKHVMLDWVNQLHLEGKLSLLVDKGLKGNFDRIELEEMVKTALLCTQFNPLHRPRMSQVLRMLEGDGLADKWEASQTVETPRSQSCDNPPRQRYSDFVEESSLVVEAMELSGPR
ncbi:Protein NSP-INTERACTING KINASE 3 [Hibiscus syriacus]|uniref:Protein NSP-INTERACTING KINASE 3 n=1 Tax=Hibiscus syriacus TaxID=106335 RepID=A0A6A3BSZ2_HIBSY|nr:Protein NSP-INTERACTING KINASE 3 [Hibiscus syriacus]